MDALNELEAWLIKSIALFSKIVADDERRIALGEERQKTSKAFYSGQLEMAESTLRFINAKREDA